MVFGLAPMEAAEPDNSPEVARGVAFDEPIEVRLMPAGDIDYFTVEVQERGIVSWRLTDFPSPDQYSPGLKAYDSEGVLLPLIEGVAFRVIRPGRHVLSIESSSLNWLRRLVTEPFYLTFRFQPDPDPNEPNDTRKEATDIVLGERVLFTILPASDIDWVRLTPDPAGTPGRFILSYEGFTPWVSAWGASAELSFARGLREVSTADGLPVYLEISAVQGPNLFRSKRHTVDTPFYVTVRFEPDSPPPPLPETAPLRWVFPVQRP